MRGSIIDLLVAMNRWEEAEAGALQRLEASKSFHHAALFQREAKDQLEEIRRINTPFK